MYLRSTVRRNKDGSEVRYLQLAHNVWDPAAKRSRVQVLYNFGRQEPGTREAVERLAVSVARYLEPGKARAGRAAGLEFAESRPLGGTLVLDALWERLGIGPALRSLLQDRQLAQPAERVLFALTANRALAPSPKLSVARWVSEDVLISGLETTNDGACYQAMDWLLQVREPLEKEVFDRAVAVLSIEVRPIGRRAAEQTRAHVIMCWLALLLVRVAESAAGVTWRELRRQLDKIAVGTFTGPAGTFRQCTEISQAQRGILGRLGVDPPQTIYQLTPAAGR